MGKKIQLTEEQKAAWEILKPLCAEVECVEGHAFQGGDEECFIKGAKDGTTCFVFSPEFEPWTGDDE